MSFTNLTAGLHTTVFEVFGESVIVNGFAMAGIFKAEYESVDVSTAVPVSTVQPVLEIRKKDAPDVEEGDPVVVRTRHVLCGG
jgi:hypothetical protein